MIKRGIINSKYFDKILKDLKQLSESIELERKRKEYFKSCLTECFEKHNVTGTIDCYISDDKNLIEIHFEGKLIFRGDQDNDFYLIY